VFWWGIPERKRQLGRIGHRWVGNIEIVSEEMRWEDVDRTELA
jgi:hypothetical protein